MIRISILVILLILPLLVSKQAAAQGCGGLPAGVSADGTWKFHTSENHIVLPFELEGRHVLVTAEIAREKLRLILDTGMPFDGALLFEIPKVNKLEFKHRTKVMASIGGCGNAQPTTLAYGENFRLGELELGNQSVTIIPVGHLLGSGLTADGIIGMAIFGRLVTSIDYDRMVITLTKPEIFSYTGSGAILPLTTNMAGMPEITSEVEMSTGKRVPVNLVVDLGAGHALSLQVGSHENIVLPERHVKSHLGHTMSGDLYGHIGRIKKLHLGKYELTDVVTSFTGGERSGVTSCQREGNLGNAALKRFHVTFDYSNERLILEPNNGFDEPFNFGASGCSLGETDSGEILVKYIIPDSPADESGLQIDDQIVTVNGSPVSEYNIDTLRELLREKGSSVNLAVVRDGQKLQAALKLRELI